jgi:3-hydroxyacyl-CoA dehydrogenase/enoyl-CoA hydratase/3-hydroxybutyryl-CoA epimerase/3-hydroxyacyl-CoA dehydrogenase/enoyl-CoA hydratase/3-hydroxybutyryl-CoA epimerase/enoyl-CoA isomerase
MPMGPLELYDMVGIDTALFAGRVIWNAYSDRVQASPILPAAAQGRPPRPEERAAASFAIRARAPPDQTRAANPIPAWNRSFAITWSPPPATPP